MTMTPRFKFGSLLLLALVLLVGAVWLLQENKSGGPSVDLSLDGLGDGSGDDPRLLANGQDPNGPGGSGTTAGGLQGSGNGLVGAREPSGIDYSDPEVRASELARLLDAGDWRGAAKIVGLMTEPVPQVLRDRILLELRTGKRLQAMHVFRQLRDPSFVQDLFDILDNAELPKGAHKTALEALWQMPGAPADDVALRLESRLNNDMKHDRDVLFAIAARGGPEAARALVQYIQRSGAPGEIPPHILQRLDVSKSPEAARVVTDALATERNEKVLRPLVMMAAKNGARAFTEPLIDLDRDGIPVQIRQQSLHALSQIGDEKAIDYLLQKAAEPGQFGDFALKSVASISSADPAARRAISKALDEADRNPRPEKAKESLLLAIGAVGDKTAVGTVGKQLDDRSEAVRRAAARALGRLGPSAESYVPQLAKLYESGDPQTKIHVAVAMGSIGGADAVKTMEQALKQKDLSPTLKRTLQMSLGNARSRIVKAE